MGATTSPPAATSGAFQNDSKRVTAYSTRSQSGHTILACGISSYPVTMSHSMNHASPKALSSSSAGAIIHAMHDEQDMRRMGAPNRLLPFTYTATLIGSFALIGFPSPTGYYPKDFISELASSKYTFAGNFAYRSGTIPVSFTTSHPYRSLLLTFPNRNNPFKRYIAHAHEANPATGLPLALLAIGSLSVGYSTKDTIVGLGSPFWANSISVFSKNMSYLEAEYSPYHVKAIPLVFSHLGIFIAYHTTSSRLAAQTESPRAPADSTRGAHSEQWGRCWDNMPLAQGAQLQKSLTLHELFLQTSPLPMAIYRFFNQK